MIRHQVWRGLQATTATAVALALSVSLTPAAQAATTPAPTEAVPDPVQVEDPALGEDGVEVRLATAGGTRSLTTTRPWAAQLLQDEGVAVDGDDLVRVVRSGRRVAGGARRLRAGDTVRVVDVERTRRAHDTRIDRAVRTRTVLRVRPGHRRVIRRGRPGLRRTVVSRTLHDGRVVEARRSSRVVRRPVARRVLVGHRFGSVPGADRLSWHALARCESTNNPRAVNPAGYYGLYQFNPGTWATVGGSGLPSRASAAEQTYRAKKLYLARGRSPWPHCGRLL